MVKSLHVKLRPVALGVALAALPLSSANASIHDAIGGLFDGMSATEPAGVYSTQRRGVISAGGVRVRTPIRQTNLMNIRMPSADAGCGGIDLFGGSFSFVNADELIATFRQIASNAKGYAFSIALRTVASDILTTMEDMQQKVQALNSLSVNSCEWAQGLVNAGADAIENQFGKQLATRSSDSGFADGFFNVFSGQDDGESDVRSNSPDEYGELTGNLVWNVLKSNDVEGWNWLGDSGSDDFLQAIMSLSGTYIVGQKTTDAEERETNPLPGYVLTLRDFVEGASDVEIYQCDSTDRCENPTITTTELVGLGQRISNMLLGGNPMAEPDTTGTGSSIGLIYRYGNPVLDGYEPSAQERNLMTSLPYGAGAMIRNLSVLEPGTAELFVREHANTMALDAAYQLASAMMRAAQQSLVASRSSYSSEAMQVLNESRDRLDTDYRALRADYGSLRELLDSYSGLIENTRRQRYHLNNMSNFNGAAE